MNRFETESTDYAAKATEVCQTVERCVTERPGTAVAVSLAAGVAAGLLVSGMIRDVIRSSQRRSLFDSLRMGMGETLRDAMPQGLKDRWS